MMFNLNKKKLSEELIKSVKAEGATDQDINWWWRGLSDLERNNVKQNNRLQILSTTAYFCETLGMSQEDAIRATIKKLINYHDFPIDQEHLNTIKRLGFGHDDCALPWELSGRIGTYIKELSKNEEDFKKQLEDFPTVNAFLRDKIRSGELKEITDYTK